MQTKKLTQEQILARANQAKDRFSASKGKSDQIISDSLSDAMNQMLQIVQQLLQERAQDESKIRTLELQLRDAQSKKPIKQLPKSETPKK